MIDHLKGIRCPVVRMHLDYIFFLYGLGFILLAGVCYTLSKHPRATLPWIWLGLFGAIHGLNEWLDLLALDVVKNPSFDIIRLIVLIASFVCLFEFARRSSLLFGSRLFAAAAYSISFCLIIIGLSVFGLKGGNVLSRYTLGFFGSILSSIALFGKQFASAQASRKSRYIVAFCFGVYGFISGFIVPKLPFFPASVFSQEAFLTLTGIPVQLFRGIMACGAAGALWFYLHSLSKTAVERGNGAKITSIAAASLIITATAGYIATNYSSKEVIQQYTCQTRFESRTVAGGIDADQVALLTGSKSDLGTKGYQNIMHYLQRLKEIHCDSEIYFHEIAVVGLRNNRLVCLARTKNDEPCTPEITGQSFIDTDSGLQKVIQGQSPLELSKIEFNGEPAYSYVGLVSPHSNKLAGVLVFQADTEDWKNSIDRQRLTFIVCTLLACIVILLWSISILSAKNYNSLISASERRYRSLVEGSRNVIAFFDAQGYITSINKAGEELLGVTNDELSTRKFHEIWPEDLRDYIISTSEQISQGASSSFEAEYIRSDGKRLFFSVVMNPIFDIDGKVSECAAIWNDLTERVNTRAALEASEEKYRDLFENARDYIFCMDTAGRVLTVNKACEEVMGYKIEDNLSIFDIVTPQYHSMIKGFLAQKISAELTNARYEVEAYDADRTIHCIEVSSRGVYKDGRLVEIQVMGHDITERRIAEQELTWQAEINLTMADVSSALLSNATVERIAELIQQYAMRITQSETGFVGYIDTQIDCLVCPCVGGDSLDSFYPLYEAGDHNAFYNQLICHGKILISNSPQTCTGWPGSRNSQIATKRVLAVPVVHGGELMGLIVVGNAARDYDARDISYMERLAMLFAIAIKDNRTADSLRIQTLAVNSTSDVVVITDLHGRIEYVNPAFEKETGYTSQEAIGKTPRVLNSGTHDEQFFKNMWETILSGKTWYGEITNKRKDGSFTIEDTTITPIKDDDGKLEHFVAIKRNIAEKKTFEAKLDYLSYHDTLTTLPNRLNFSERLSHCLAGAHSAGQQVAVMFMDVDQFKLVNDTLGHNIGDLLLKRVADRLVNCLRDADTVARMGGDEFAVIISNVKDEESAVSIANRILGNLNEPFSINGHEVFVSISIGIGIYPADGSDVDTLVKNADTAMFRAKNRGRNNYQFFNEAFSADDFERMLLEYGLRKALEREEFLLYYQPQVEIKTGRVIGAESLIRWKHPEHGVVSPAKFIPLAEETGLIVPMSKWILREACRQNKLWQIDGMPPMVVSVNISSRQLTQECLADDVSEALRESGLDPCYLELELTESGLMENPELTIATLDKIKKMGVKIAVDDFGTGYSSLSYLKRFPIDTVKIDQSFVQEITTNSDDAAIAGAVVAMSHSLKLKVIAEGVETTGQLDLLRNMGCDNIQGYLISKPVAADEFQGLIKSISTHSQARNSKAA